MKRSLITLTAVAVFVFAVVASAAPTRIFQKYETVRQALLAGSLGDAQSAAKALSDAAVSEKQSAVAERAKTVAGAANLKAAREAFAKLSDDVIAYRDAQSGARPVVVYCSMHKASWLQPKGAITNPYAESKSMVACGEVRKDNPTSAMPMQHDHRH